MPQFKGINVNTKEHVDHIVKEEVKKIFGSDENENKFHRLAITGLYLMMNQNAFGGSRKDEIVKIREIVLPKFLEVEKIVKEGNDFCKTQGWTR